MFLANDEILKKTVTALSNTAFQETEKSNALCEIWGVLVLANEFAKNSDYDSQKELIWKEAIELIDDIITEELGADDDFTGIGNEMFGIITLYNELMTEDEK